MTDSALNTPLYDDDFRQAFSSMVRSRRATRVYQEGPLPEEDIKEFLELVLEAPSAFNLQDRSIVVIQDEAVRAEVLAAANNQKQVATAPLLLAFIAEPSGWKRTLPQLAEQNVTSGYWTADVAESRSTTISGFQSAREEAGLAREFAIRNAMIAASFAMLTAPAFGWSSSPMTGFNEAALKKAIGAENTDTVVALLLAVGVPAEEPRHPGRFPADGRVYLDRYEG